MMRLHAVAAIAPERCSPPLFVLVAHFGMDAFDDIEFLATVANSTAALHFFDWNKSDMGFRKICFRMVAKMTIGAVNAFLEMDVLLQIFHRN